MRLGIVGLCLSPLVGCSSDESEPSTAETGEEDEVVPADAKTLWDQAKICSDVESRHRGIQSSDYKNGTVRWGCGDVPGVTGDDLGQEYCEYSAVAGGKPVNTLADAGSAPLQCLFTSLYADAFDAKGNLGTYVDALGAKENLGAKPAAAVTQMQVGFNSRGAASALVVDCLTQATPEGKLRSNDFELRDKTPAEVESIRKNILEEQRQAACWLAADGQVKAGNQAKADALKKSCRISRGKLLTEAKWKKIEAQGVKIKKAGEAGFDEQQTMAGCMGSYRSGAVTWRNSDNMICERVTRAVSECGCGYNVIPEDFFGFSFGTWTNDKGLPQGCRFAKVGGKESPNLVICELSQSQRDDLETNDQYAGDLKMMCHDYFANEIVMSAPIRALQVPDTCKSTPGFCASYGGQ